MRSLIFLLFFLSLGGAEVALAARSVQPSCPNMVSLSNRPALNDLQLDQLAQSITVRVLSAAVAGSGVIVGQQGKNYQVLTNAHNLLGTDQAQVQTSDGVHHFARRAPRQSWGKKDLVLLEFQSQHSYPVAQWFPQLATPGLEIVAVGFEFDHPNITISRGKVARLLEKPLKSGYQLGYTSKIQQGMSGGPILDRTGLLLGINAMSAYPLLNRAYLYADGSRPSNSQIRELRRFNWGIPLQNYGGCLNLSQNQAKSYSPILD